ncbi:unnamed protein product, partial [marine sediment metagenome]
MKTCDNCFEINSDGATNCVICGELLDVPQVEQTDEVAVSESAIVGVEAAEAADDLSPADSIEGSEAETGEDTADGTGPDDTLVERPAALAGDQDEAVQEAASTESTEPPSEVGFDMEPGSREDDTYVEPPAGLAETPTETDELSAAPAEA